MGRGNGFSASSPALCLVLAFALQLSPSLGTVHGHSQGDSQKDWTSSLEGKVASSLSVPSGNKIQQFLFAVGKQHYGYNGSSWVLQNATADLFDFSGVKVGHHLFLQVGGHPTWETFRPFSRVTGASIATESQEDAIPWLLLEATQNSGSLKLFGSSTFIQRLYTQNGRSPAADVPAQEGDVFKSDYTAFYSFASKETSPN